MGTKKHSLTCFCENTFEVEFPEIVDLEESPEKEDEIINGSFMSFSCPLCGKVLKPEIPVRVRDKKRNIDIYFLPESERYTFMSGKTPPPDCKRLVIGYKELAEKMHLYKRSLDDRIIEVIKLQLLQKAGENSDLRIFFQSVESDRLVFHIHGLKHDEIGIAKIPESVYEKIAGEIDSVARDPNSEEILTPPYVSINKVYIGED